MIFIIPILVILGLGLFYVGNTKWTDKLLRYICDTNSMTRTHYGHVSFVTKLMALILTIGLIIRGL